MSTGTAVQTRTNFVNETSTIQETGLTQNLDTVLLRAGNLLFAQDDPVERFYLIRRGLLGMYRLVYPDKRVLVGKLSQGDPVGVSFLMLDRSFPTHLMALKDTVAFEGDRAVLTRLSESHPRWIMDLVLIENDYQRQIYQKIEDLLGKELDQRIAQELLDLASHAGRPCKEGIEILIKLTRKQLSEMIGCAQESVIRILSTWEKKDWIRTDQKLITVKKPDRLRSILTS